MVSRGCLALLLMFAAAGALFSDQQPAAQAPPDDAMPPPAVAAAASRYVDRATLVDEAATLAAPQFEGRATGTPGGDRARLWIADRFKTIGLTPAGSSGYLQPFTFKRNDAASVLPGRRATGVEQTGINVLGRVAGRDPALRAIVITAHYDHLGVRNGVVYPGADDNASGIAALLAAGRHFRKTPPRRTLVFAALDAEELGLQGARSLVGSPLLPRDRIALNINLDMVSRSSRHEIYAAGTVYTPWQRRILADVQRRASVAIRLGHDTPGGAPQDWTELSDHAAFHRAGLPFVYFGVEEHADYHGPGDVPERIDARFFGDVADMVVEAIRVYDERLP